MIKHGYTSSLLANMSNMQTLRPFRFKKKTFSGVPAQRDHDEMNAPASSGDDSVSDGVGIDASGAPVGTIPDEQKAMLLGVTAPPAYMSARGPSTGGLGPMAYEQAGMQTARHNMPSQI